MLEMKAHCEKCNQETGPAHGAYICSHECTFCPDCSNEMNYVCPNCQGELVIRPKRIQTDQ